MGLGDITARGREACGPHGAALTVCGGRRPVGAEQQGLAQPPQRSLPTSGFGVATATVEAGAGPMGVQGLPLCGRRGLG